jgi:hypothetical protein
MNRRHLVHGFTEQHWKSCHKDSPAATPPQDPNDMEDPQAGEILPPMLLELFWQGALTFNGDLHDQHFKAGMECTYKALLPLLKFALPYCEAGLRDTRIAQADGKLLMELAQFKGLVNGG